MSNEEYSDATDKYMSGESLNKDEFKKLSTNPKFKMMGAILNSDTNSSMIVKSSNLTQPQTDPEELKHKHDAENIKKFVNQFSDDTETKNDQVILPQPFNSGVDWSSAIENELENDDRIVNEAMETSYGSGLKNVDDSLVHIEPFKTPENSKADADSCRETAIGLIEAIANSDTLSEGERISLLTQITVKSSSILKERFGINV